MIILEITQEYKNGENTIQVPVSIDNESKVFNKILKTRKPLEAIKEEISFTLEKIIADYTKNWKNINDIIYNYHYANNDNRLCDYVIYNLLDKNVRISKISYNFENI